MVNYKTYVSLSMLFCSIMVLGNLTYQKFIILSFVPFYKFELSVGVIFYPIIFLISDLISEFYGKEKATFCVNVSIIVNIFVSMIVILMDILPATSWSRVDNEAFHHMFGFYWWNLSCSIFAFYIAQRVDITLYLWIKSLTKDRHLWLRNNISTAVSLLIDTSLVISTMAVFDLLPIDQLWPVITHSYLWKLIVIICTTPIFYLSIFLIRRIHSV